MPDQITDYENRDGKTIAWIAFEYEGRTRNLTPYDYGNTDGTQDRELPTRKRLRPRP